MDADVALHFNPRLDSKAVVLNSRRSGEWMAEERHPTMLVSDGGDSAAPAFLPGREAEVVVKAEENHYRVLVNGAQFCHFAHRVRPENVTHVRLSGEMRPDAMVYSSKSVREKNGKTVAIDFPLSVKCAVGNEDWSYDTLNFIYEKTLMLPQLISFPYTSGLGKLSCCLKSLSR